jgi:hypothetical protein
MSQSTYDRTFFKRIPSPGCEHIYWDGGLKKIEAWKTEHLGKHRKSTNRNMAAPSIASSSADSSALCEHNRICQLLDLRTLEPEPSDYIQITDDSDDSENDPGTTQKTWRLPHISSILDVCLKKDVDTAT